MQPHKGSERCRGTATPRLRTRARNCTTIGPILLATFWRFLHLHVYVLTCVSVKSVCRHSVAVRVRLCMYVLVCMHVRRVHVLACILRMRMESMCQEVPRSFEAALRTCLVLPCSHDSHLNSGDENWRGPFFNPSIPESNRSNSGIESSACRGSALLAGAPRSSTSKSPSSRVM